MKRIILNVFLKKLIKYISILLLALSFVLFSSVYLFLGTDNGFQYLLNTASDETDGTFNYKQVKGNFFSGFEVKQITYRDSTMEVAVNSLHYDWQAKQLFSANLMVDYLRAEGIIFKQLDTKNETDGSTTAQSETELPEIILPLNIYLKEIQINDISIRTASSNDPETELISINKIKLQADFIKGKVKLHSLLLEMPEVNTTLTGQIELNNNYPLSLKNIASLTIPEQTNIEVIGTIEGDFDTLFIKQKTAGLIDSALNIQVNQLLLTALKWEADIKVEPLPLNTFMPEQKESIKANISAHGDLTQADTNVSLSVLNENNEQTEQAKTTQIELDANIMFDELIIKAKTQWQNLQWPLSGLADFASDSGVLHLDGTTDNYTMTLQLGLSGNDIPKGDWSAEAQGNLSNINISTLQGNTLNGDIKINGQVSWQEAIEWQAELQTDKVNPDFFSKQWPGSLNINLKTSGEIIDDSIKAKLKLLEFSGQLRQQPLAGGGEFDLFSTQVKDKVTQKININHFNISSAQARLSANGFIDEKIALDWSLSVAQLSDLLPDSGGSVNGQGKLTGTIKAPKIKAALKLNKIHYQAIEINEADLACDLDLNIKNKSKLHFNADTIVLSSEDPSSDNEPQLIKQIELSLNGPLNKHDFILMIDHDMARLDLETSGKFDMEKLSWDGFINKLNINSPDFGHWQQLKPAKLYASSQKAKLSELCLNEQSTLLCSELDWTPERGNAELNLSNLSFDRAKPFLPEEMKEFSGSVDLRAKLELTPTLLAQIKTVIKPGTIIYQPVNKKPIQLNHKNGLIEADYSVDKLLAKWNIDLGSHKMNGNITLPRSAIENNPMSAPINGKINIDIKDLNIITILAPQINQIDGHFQSRLKLDGNISEPRITGYSELIASVIDIRELGTRYTNLKINIKDKDYGQSLSLNGGLQSEKGALTLDGQISLDTNQGFPIEMKIKGKNFLAINIPDLYAILSPDIQFSQNKGLMDIKGELFIPDASISPSSLPEGSVSVSSDVVILGEKIKTPPNMNLDVSIKLGKKVNLRAFGLKTDLTGEMSINQQPKQLMVAHGELHLENGTFRAYGQDLTIDKGSVFYADGYLDNPGLKFTASRLVNETKVGIKVSGTAKKPKVKTFSDDTSLTDKDIVSLMLTGQKTDNLENARVYAGTDINDRLSVGVNAGMGDEGSEFVTRYRLTDKIHVEGTSSSSKSGGSFLYSIEIE